MCISQESKPMQERLMQVLPRHALADPITECKANRERESLHLSSHTWLMQVLPGHPLAITMTECSITV